MQRIVVFGTSKGGEKVAEALFDLGFDIEFFLDNSCQKWGQTFMGKSVKAPNHLLEQSEDYQIVIASVYYAEIETQLLSMGIKKENIVPKETFYKQAIDERIKRMERIPIKEAGCDVPYIFDCAMSFEPGGVREWTASVASGLMRINRKVRLVGDTKLTNCEPWENWMGCYEVFEWSSKHYWDSLKQWAFQLLDASPCVVVCSHIDRIFLAAYIAKKLYPERIKIISVIHESDDQVHRRNKIFEEVIDALFCVSTPIVTNMLKRYQCNPRKLYQKSSPVAFDKDFVKKYSPAGEPIVIGYAARLEKLYKRSELILPLIDELEALNLDYRLDIAGTGSCYALIKDYVQSRKLEAKISLKGWLDHTRMLQFWEDKDIYINVSELEGGPITLLEAMSCGAVPIATDTGLASEFVIDTETGFLCSDGDVGMMAQSIQLLSVNRSLLMKLGQRARRMVSDKCSEKEYINFFTGLV